MKIEITKTGDYPVRIKNGEEVMELKSVERGTTGNVSKKTNRGVYTWITPQTEVYIPKRNYKEV